MNILIAGLPGRMACEVVDVLCENPSLPFRLLPVALSSPRHAGKVHRQHSWQAELLGPEQLESHALPETTLAIDFTTPSAALDNISHYVTRSIPFVMGTTGFDLNRARELVETGRVAAVIAPNMSIPIVLVQWALEQLSRTFPGALSDFTARVAESHQATKRDTSGTARAMVSYLARLGLPIGEAEIERERDPMRQQHQWGVPAEHLAGHAYHRYDVCSPGGDVRLRLEHQVHGRRTYALGAWRAALFLHRHRHTPLPPRVYSMLDVLAEEGG